MFGKYDFLPNKALFTLFAQDSCRRKTIDLICENILFLLGGYDSKQLNMVSTKLGFMETCSNQFVSRIAYQKSLSGNVFFIWGSSINVAQKYFFSDNLCKKVTIKTHGPQFLKEKSKESPVLHNKQKTIKNCLAILFNAILVIA